MSEKIAVTYCVKCEMIYHTTNMMTKCGICHGDTKEIGWIEQNG